MEMGPWGTIGEVGINTGHVRTPTLQMCYSRLGMWEELKSPTDPPGKAGEKTPACDHKLHLPTASRQLELVLSKQHRNQASGGTRQGQKMLALLPGAETAQQEGEGKVSSHSE